MERQIRAAPPDWQNQQQQNQQQQQQQRQHNATHTLPAGNAPAPALKYKKPRPGARGMNKTRTGCQTCKKRHRKCDEHKPACHNCIRTGWTCDYESTATAATTTITMITTTTPAAAAATTTVVPWQPSTFVAQLSADELVQLDLFATVAVKAMSISLNAPQLERIMLRAVQTEPCILHAALSWAALTRHVYWRGDDGGARARSHRQGFAHYNRSIRALRRLGRTRRAAELALLAAHVYASIDFNLGLMDRLVAHAAAAAGMAREMAAAVAARPAPDEDGDSIVRLARAVHAEFAAQIQAWNELSPPRRADRGLVRVEELDEGPMQRLALVDDPDSRPAAPQQPVGSPGEAFVEVEEVED